MEKSDLGKYTDFLLSVAIKKCGNLEEARDITQEAFLSALCFLSKGGKIDQPKAWLVSVLNRRFFDLLRKKYKLPTVCLDTIMDYTTAETAYKGMEESEEAAEIRRNIAFLSNIHREVIIRYYIHNKSVEDIVGELKIPTGTVKSRLYAGREHIKKGFFNMESYTRQSYEPETLYLSWSGRCGMNGEPWTVTQNDLIAKNILIIAYNEPLTEVEISQRMGIPTAYTEPIIKNLIDNELMRRLGNKVYTDFIVFTASDVSKTLPAQKELVSNNFGSFWVPLNKGLENLRITSLYDRLSERQKSKLEYYFLFLSLANGLYEIGEKIYNEQQTFPDRPNGGKWIAMGFAYPKNYNLGEAEYNKYNWAGERRYSWVDIMGVKTIEFHVFDTSLETKKYSWLKYSMTDSDLAKMLHIIHQKIPPEAVGYNTVFYENIPHLTECGVLYTDKENTTVDIPVLSSEEYRELYALRTEIIGNLFKETESIIAKHLKNAKTEIPKHLTSVPLQKQYMQAMNCLHMMIVYKAIENGLFLNKVNYPCPPMILVIDNK